MKLSTKSFWDIWNSWEEEDWQSEWSPSSDVEAYMIQVSGSLLLLKRAPGAVMDPRSVAHRARKGICCVTVRMICLRFDAFVVIKQGISHVTVFRTLQQARAIFRPRLRKLLRRIPRQPGMRKVKGEEKERKNNKK